MKTFNFNCLPEQLYAWAQQSQGVPSGVNVGHREATEILFTTLFPNIRNYQTRYSPGSDSHSADAGKRSVDIQPFYRRAGRSDIKIFKVRITDTTDNCQTVISSINKSGLLQGNDLIEEKVREAVAIQDAEEAARFKKNLYFSIPIFVLIIVLAFSI